MNEELKTLYAQWIYEECSDPISEIEWLVNCIIHNKGKKAFIQDIQWVLKNLEQKVKDDEKISDNN